MNGVLDWRWFLRTLQVAASQGVGSGTLYLDQICARLEWLFGVASCYRIERAVEIGAEPARDG
jgi:hypothetical protein